MDTGVDLKILLEHVAGGGLVDTPTFLSLAQRFLLVVKSTIDGNRKVVQIDCPKGAVVFGPTRGHAADLAHQLLTVFDLQLDGDVPSPSRKKRGDPSAFVFLGNYIDGGYASVETLCVVLALHSHFEDMRAAARDATTPLVVVLRGVYEHLYPSTPEGKSSVCAHGTLEEEVRIRQLQLSTSHPSFRLEDYLVTLFRELPVACVINKTFVCLPSGISPLADTLDDIESAFASSKASSVADGERRKSIQLHVMSNEPMDDDDAYSLPHGTLFAASEERKGAYVYSCAAVKAFFKANRLLTGGSEMQTTQDATLTTLIRGNFYATNRSDDMQLRNNCGRPWHYQHSPYDPGYRLYGPSGNHEAPTILTLFSAPSFRSMNRNFGAFLTIKHSGEGDCDQSARRVNGHCLCIEQFSSAPSAAQSISLRSHRNAFAWSVPMLLGYANQAVAAMLDEHVDSEANEEQGLPAATQREADGCVSDAKKRDSQLERMRVLCKLLLKNGFDLPNLARQ